MIIGKESFDGIYMSGEVDKELKHYMNHLMDYTGGVPYERYTEVAERVKIPDGYNCDYTKVQNRTIRQNMERFWKAEKKKIKHGHGPMCGAQYNYFNYFKDRTRPIAFRRHDNNVHQLIMRCVTGDLKGKGLNYLGRRREGKTNKLGNVICYYGMRMKGGTFIISSKTEKDAQDVILQGKIKYALDRLPIPIKPKKLKDNDGEIYLGEKMKDERGDSYIGGLNNHIIASTPKAVAIEGQTVRLWAHDESGKTQYFRQLVDNSLPALAGEEGFDREGFVWLIAVAGDFNKHGTDYKDIWNSSHTSMYNLIKFFSPGWSGGAVDQFGNEDIEKMVRKILIERKDILNNKEETIAKREIALYKRMQQYPLTVEESLQSAAFCKFNARLLEEQEKFLLKADFHPITGDINFVDPTERMPRWNPGVGPIQLIETPQQGSNYVAGIDAYGLKRQDQTGSEGGCVIWKMPNVTISPVDRENLWNEFKEASYEDKIATIKLLGPLPVALYHDGPRNPNVFAKKCAALIKWFHYESKMQTPLKALIEREPPIIFDRFDQKHKLHIAFQPLRPGVKPTFKELTKLGIDLKGYWAEKRLEQLNWIIDNYVQFILFPDLIKKLQTYNDEKQDKKHDIVDGLGLVGILLTDPRIQAINKINHGATPKKRKAKVSFRRNH